MDSCLYPRQQKWPLKWRRPGSQGSGSDSVALSGVQGQDPLLPVCECSAPPPGTGLPLLSSCPLVQIQMEDSRVDLSVESLLIFNLYFIFRIIIEHSLAWAQPLNSLRTWCVQRGLTFLLLLCQTHNFKKFCHYFVGILLIPVYYVVSNINIVASHHCLLIIKRER